VIRLARIVVLAPPFVLEAVSLPVYGWLEYTFATQLAHFTFDCQPAHYALADSRSHFAFDPQQAHYAFADNRTHFTMTEEG
jgi:hypothetical protein